jgi:hypothetical protein
MNLIARRQSPPRTDKLRKQASLRGHNQASELWARKKSEIEQEAEVIRQAIMRAVRTVAALAEA